MSRQYYRNARLNARAYRNGQTWIVLCFMRERRKPPSYSTRRRTAPFPRIPSFSPFSFSRPLARRKHAAQFFRAAAVFFSQLYNTQFSDRVISTPPLLNSIRHDIWLFLETFKHRDRFSQRAAVAVVRKPCFPVQMRDTRICVLSYA